MFTYIHASGKSVSSFGMVYFSEARISRALPFHSVGKFRKRPLVYILRGDLINSAI